MPSPRLPPIAPHPQNAHNKALFCPPLGAEPPQCPVPAGPGSAPTVPAPDLRPPAQGRPPRLGDSTSPAECARRVVGQGRSQVARRGQAPALQPDVPDHQNKVVSWIDVYSRATCQPREVVVPLTTEFMGTVAKQLVPSCVTVHRCGGCCPDDGLECVPTGQHQVRMQILMIRYPSSQLGEMSLEEHSRCECRPKKRESSGKPDSPRPLCPRCAQRRQRPDPRTCRCRCRRRSFLRCQGRGLELNPNSCRCRKLRR
ncbi:vascular endothelial growth factor B [Echinops telfairi]|uniref:Vascular endothelial growth factor B n=1 Tax=Echinops telfairi TaxID=9371 RepID=A0AC55DN02_ECHTE|nr:vascular endothelial growth factor B [Echinops telfairi]